MWKGSKVRRRDMAPLVWCERGNGRGGVVVIHGCVSLAGFFGGPATPLPPTFIEGEDGWEEVEPSSALGKLLASRERSEQVAREFR